MKKDIRPKKSDWIKLGERICEKIRQRTKAGKGVDRDFKGYTESYKKIKKANNISRQSSTSMTPDLTLTGDMLRDLQVRKATRDMVQIGWTGTEAQKVFWNEEMGRKITTKAKPLAKSINKFAINELEKFLGKNIKKAYATRKQIKINV